MTKTPIRWTLLCLFALFSQVGLSATTSAEEKPTVRVLFLGDKGHHKPADRAAQLIPVLAKRGVFVTYTDDVEHLNPEMLNQYDGLIIYANITSITPAQESALLDYVNGGGGLIPLHSASYCFLNSPKYVALVGAQFQRHKTGIFRVKPTAPDHPVLKGFKGFESWDETYVHTKHNTRNRVVLQTRREGDRDEPWTWVRTEGKGRVFYSAWGHDQRTWGNEGFHELVERGIRWATEPRVKERLAKVEPFKYVKAGDAIPNYPPSGKWGTQDKPLNMMQAPLPGEQSAKHIVTPPNMQAKLYAGDPDIDPALAMAFDARGRLWLCESVDYPNDLQPHGKGNDRIRICEDTDGDGKADKFTVFADKLSIPTALTFYRGGVIVQDGTRTLYLKDTNGDDVADVRKTLITGWNMGDTHGGVSNFTYGHDNWIWAMQGYNNSRPRVGDKTYPGFRMGFFRFRLDQNDPPNVTDIEFLRSTNNNTWGIGFNEEGVVFGSTANRNPSDYMPIPNRYYERVRGWSPTTLGSIARDHLFYPVSDKVRQVDHHHGFTAGTGHRLYTARRYPRHYWNRTAFVTGPTGKLAGTFVIEPNGSGFKSSNRWNIAASDDEWFAPIAAEVGPDGNVWLLDWYNYVVQHNPTPIGFKRGKGNAYESTLRDKKFGRVYRVAYGKDGAESHALQSVGLSAQSTKEQFLSALSSDNLFWRRHAQRLIIERGKLDIVPDLVALARSRSIDAIGLNAGAIHALWTLHGLGALEGTDRTALAGAIDALRHPSAGVRRNAVQVLPGADDSLRAILDAGLLNDPEPQVRLMALLAIADMSADRVTPSTSDRAAAAVLAMLKQPRNANDRWITEAATSAAAMHDAGFLRALLGATQAKGEPQPKQVQPKPVNLIKNGNLETIHGGKPQHWRSVIYSGRATFEVAQGQGRNGSHAVKITSTAGADASWTYDLPVKPNTRYRVIAYVKTTGLNKGASLGALINLHELQKVGKTQAVSGDKGWTRITSEFETAGRNKLALNLLFGGWGQARGTALWDDVEVIEVGPATGATPALAVGAVSGRLGQVVSIVTRHYAQRGPKASVVATLAALRGADEALAGYVLDGLVGGWPTDAKPTLSDVDKAQLAVLSAGLPADQQQALIVLLRRWGHDSVVAGDVKRVVMALQSTLADSEQPIEARVDAARRLVRLSGEASTVADILKPVSPQAPAELSVGLISAVADARNATVGTQILSRWSRFTPAARRAAIDVLLRRSVWTKQLLDAIAAGTLHRADLAAADWQLLKLSKDQSIAEQANKLDTLSGDPDRAKLLTTMLPYLEKPVDLKVGAQHFKKLCSQCHSLNGAGGAVGPDLTGIGSRPAREVLAEIVDPNRSVESNYRLWIIENVDGDRLSGRLDGESRTSVELLDLQGKRHVIQRADIDTIRATPISIMPVGLIDMLKPEEIASLIAYLRAAKGHN